jgi:hypothetical protein
MGMAPKDRRPLVLVRPSEDVADDALVDELSEALGVELVEDDDDEGDGGDD